MNRSIRMLVFVSFFIAVLSCVETEAAIAAGKSDCIHFSSDSAKVKLKLYKNSIVASNLPFRLCEFEYGKEYGALLWGDKYEKREGRLTVNSNGEIFIWGNRSITCLKNGLLPGYGTYLRGRKRVSAIDFLSIAGSAYKLYRETDEYNELQDKFDRINTSLSQVSKISDKIDLQEEAHRTSIYVNLQNRYRKKLIIFSSVLYAYQLIEPIFMDIPPEVYSDSNENSIKFKAINKNITKAFLYSFLRPGRGQFYQGKTMRGVFFSSMVIFAGFVSLDLNNQYNRDAVDYNLCMDRFSSASTIEDKRKYAASGSLLWEKVENSKEKRNRSIYILAGLWGWNVIDTLFPCDKSGSNSNYSLNVTPLGCELAINF